MENWPISTLEFPSFRPKKPKCYSLVRPDSYAVPLVADSPHSGVILPEDFQFVCSLADLRQSDEFYVDQLAGRAVEFGGTVLKALVSRAYIDLNRAIGDIHPDICSSPIPWPVHRSKRVLYGIGLIRHLIGPNEPVYNDKLSLEEITSRIVNYYDPYYAALEEELMAAKQEFGRVLHINLHSMPNIGLDGGPQQADIVLGDHDGHSCGRVYRETAKKYFESCGLKVMINNPYKGAELTRRFSRPRQGIHSMQIEVNKALFMDEETLAATDGLSDMLKVFEGLWAQLAEILPAVTMPRAAE